MNNTKIKSTSVSLTDNITTNTLFIIIQGGDENGKIWTKESTFVGQDALDTWNSWGSDDSSIISKVLNS